MDATAVEPAVDGPAPGSRPGPSGAPRRPPFPAATAGGLTAAGVAWAAMTLMRATLQVRTLPERLTEWGLLFVPLDLFEAGLRRFGFDAKRYALAGAALVMFAALAAIGAAVLRRRWPARRLAALALGLWLLTMLGVMPLTGAGPFATSLIRGTGAVVAGYLAVALAYAGALSVAAAVIALTEGGAAPSRRPATGRPALLLAAVVAAALARIPPVAGWSAQPPLPAAVVPLRTEAPAAVFPAAAPPATPAPAPAPSAGPPSGAPRAPEVPATPEVPSTAEPWNTAVLDVAANGNLARAVELVVAAGVPDATAAAAGRAPWQLVGEVHEFTGTVERSRLPEDGSAPPWSDAGRPAGEVVLTGSAGDSVMPVVCVTFALTDAATFQEGDLARARGYVVGLTSTDVRGGGTTTGLVLVGELTRLPV